MLGAPRATVVDMMCHITWRFAGHPQVNQSWVCPGPIVAVHCTPVHMLPPRELKNVVPAGEWHASRGKISYGDPIGRLGIARPLNRDIPCELRAARTGRERHDVPHDMPVHRPAPCEPELRLIG